MIVVVDTTVLVYAVGNDHALREPARALVQAVASGGLRATTTPEVIQEFAHVRSRHRGLDDGARLAELYTDLLSPLIEVGEHDLRDGLELFRAHERLGALDAVLASAALRRGATWFVSADSAFSDVPDLSFRDLAALEVDALT